MDNSLYTDSMADGFVKMTNVLEKYDLDETKQRRISREFQDYAYRLAVALDDTAHTPIYMRLVKNTPREVIEKAKSFVMDSNARSKGKLFMWKLRQLKTDTGSLGEKLV
jgi:hypothetical protein